MTIKISDHQDFGKIAEIRNGVFHLLTSDPSSPSEGQFYFNTTGKRAKLYQGVTDGWGQFVTDDDTLNILKAPTSSIAMGTQKFTGLAAGTTNGDSVRYEQVVGVYAPLASPTFTGTPSLPTGTTGVTQTAGNNTTALATTAFVTTAVNAAYTGTTNRISVTSGVIDIAATYVGQASITTLGTITTGTWTGTTIAVANGGTGATTAAAARTNLGAVNIAGDTMTGTLSLAGLANINPTGVIDIRSVGGSAYANATLYQSGLMFGAGGASTQDAGIGRTGAGVLLVVGKVQHPTAPTVGDDLTNKTYVDAAVQTAQSGLDVKQSVRAATTTAGTLASSFENGDTIDGVTLVTGNRILIKNQSTGSENGIYTVNASGAPTRATDADTSAEVTAGMFMFVEEGTVNADTSWVLTTNNTITLGSTALTFAQFGAGATYTGTTNRVTVTGTVIDIASNYVGQNTITTLGTITTGTWNGTAIPVANGGTGATTASNARNNLGAVNKAGDTMTGHLSVGGFTVGGSSGTNNSALGAFDLYVDDGTTHYAKYGAGYIEFGPTSGSQDWKLYRTGIGTATMNGVLEIGVNSIVANFGVFSGSFQNGSVEFLSNVAKSRYQAVGIELGGTGSHDWTLTRTGANIAAIGSGDKLQQNTAPSTGDDLVNKTYADTKLSLTGGTLSGFINLQGFSSITGGTGTFPGLGVYITGDSTARLKVGLNPSDQAVLELGPGGGSARDWTLTRTGANIATIGSGDKLQQNAAPTVGDDLVNKTYADGLVSSLSGTYVTLATTQTISGAKTFSGLTTFSNDTTVSNGNDLNLEAFYLNFNSTEYNAVLNSYTDNGTNNYIGLQIRGQYIRWGDPSSLDTTLSRTAAGILSIGAGNKFQQNAAPTVGDDLTNKTYVDAQIAGAGGTYAATFGNGSSTSIAITHSLGTRDVLVEVYDVATYDTVMCSVVRTSTSQITLGFAVAPATNSLRVIVKK